MTFKFRQLPRPQALFDFCLGSLYAAIWCCSLLGQFGRVVTPLGKMSWHEPLIVLVIVMLIISLKSWRFKLTKIWWLVILNVTWMMIVTLLRAWQYDSLAMLVDATVIIGRWLTYLLFLALSWRWLDYKPTWKTLVINGVFWWLTLQAFFGITQYLFLPDTRWLWYLGWDDHFNRAFGTLFDPGFFGLIMAWGAGQVILHWHQQRRRSSPWLILLSVLVLALALSFSRASYLAYMSGVLFLSWQCRQRRLLLLIPLLIMAIVLTPKDGGGEGQKLLRTNSIAARTEVAQHHTRKLSWDEALIGRGWSYETALQTRAAGLAQDTGQQFDTTRSHAQMVDSFPLHLFLTGGIVGLLLVGTLVWKIWLNLNIGAQLSVIIISTHSLLSPSWMYPWMLLLLVSATSQLPQPQVRRGNE